MKGDEHHIHNNTQLDPVLPVGKVGLKNNYLKIVNRPNENSIDILFYHAEAWARAKIPLRIRPRYKKLYHPAVHGTNKTCTPVHTNKMLLYENMVIGRVQSRMNVQNLEYSSEAESRFEFESIF
jgi:hypothetical protein